MGTAYADQFSPGRAKQITLIIDSNASMSPAELVDAECMHDILIDMIALAGMRLHTGRYMMPADYTALEGFTQGVQFSNEFQPTVPTCPTWNQLATAFCEGRAACCGPYQNDSVTRGNWGSLAMFFTVV